MLVRRAAIAAACVAATCALPRVKTLSNPGRFVLESGEAFTPQGANYIRLNGSDAVAPVYHATFSPLFYNSTAAALALDDLAVHGYNFVRVFIDGGAVGRTDGINGDGSQPLSNVYIRNLVDFIHSAEGAGVYVMLTLTSLPVNAWFQPATPSWCQYPHCDMMAPQSVAAWVNYTGLLSEMLVSALKGDTSALLAYSLVNEGFFLDTALPFASNDLVITTADGVTYNMSNAASRQQCADANAVYWLNSCGSALAMWDPDTLVTAGMFTFMAVGKSGPNGIYPSGSDPRHPFRPAVISRYASLGYLDIHVYLLGPGWTVATDLASSEWASVDADRMPIAMCETGAFKRWYTSAAAGAAMLQCTLHDACSQNISGWGVWTYDTWEQSDILWNLRDAGGTMEDALAPATHPDGFCGIPGC